MPVVEGAVNQVRHWRFDLRLTGLPGKALGWRSWNDRHATATFDSCPVFEQFIYFCHSIVPPLQPIFALCFLDKLRSDLVPLACHRGPANEDELVSILQ
jgi:hypothetical protein